MQAGLSQATYGLAVVTGHTLDEDHFDAHRMRLRVELFKGRAKDKIGDDPEAVRQWGGCVRVQRSFVDLRRNSGRRPCCVESIEERCVGLFTWSKIGELFEDQLGKQGALLAGPGGYKRPE